MNLPQAVLPPALKEVESMSTKIELRLIRQWEERLVEDYYEYRCQKLLEPLYDELQQWKEGAISHETLFDAVARVHRENRERYNFFARKRDDLARWIQLDPWFDQWIATHPAPDGADLLSEEEKRDPAGWQGDIGRDSRSGES
jgi:hypothetical protein